MIGLNPLRTKVLITVDEVLFHAPTGMEMDARAILQSIIIAERRFIKPMVGIVPYNALVEAKNILVTSANLASLQTDINAGRDPLRDPIVLVAGDYVNSDTYLTDLQLELWQNYLHKITAECVYHITLPVHRSKLTNTGLVHKNPNNINNDGQEASVELRDLKHLMDKTLHDRISPLMEDMVGFMCESKYTGFDTTNCKDCTGEDGRYIKKSGFILGMYDDDEDCKCNF